MAEKKCKRCNEPLNRAWGYVCDSCQAVKAKERRKRRPRRRKVPPAVRRRLEEKYPVCVYCGEDTPHLVIEHLTPVVDGGTDAEENLARACNDCNNGKGTQSVEAFMAGGVS